MVREEIYCRLMAGVERGEREFTQKRLAEELGISLGTINYALKPLMKVGAVMKKRRGFFVSNPKKLLIFWAVHHSPKVEYSTFCPSSAEEMESLMPGGIFTAYSGAKLYYGINPADYGEVFIYADCGEVARRFPKVRGRENIFCLRKLKCFKVLGLKKAPLSLIYVDLFNLPTWYSTEFLREVEVRLNELLE